MRFYHGTAIALACALITAPTALAVAVSLNPVAAPGAPSPAPSVPIASDHETTLFTIVSPTDDDVFAGGESVRVAWTSLVNDFTGLQSLYVVEVRHDGDLMGSAVRDYDCRTLAPGQFECGAMVTMPMEDAEYEIQVRFIDARVGDLDETAHDTVDHPREAHVHVFVDGLAPATALDVFPAPGLSGYVTSEAGLSLLCTDATSGCAETYYRLNGGPKTVYEGPFMLPGDGVHTIRHWSVDNAGNAEDHVDTVVRQDTVPPTLTLEADADPDGDAGWYVTPPTATGTCADATSGCIDPIIHFPAFDGDGEHEFVYAAPDVAGNVGGPLMLGVRQDSTPPAVLDVCALSAGDCLDAPGPMTTALVTVGASMSDAMSGLATRTMWATSSCGAGSMAPVVVPAAQTGVTLDLRPLADNPGHNVYVCDEVTIHARAVDEAGLETTASSAVYVLDTTGPANILVELVNDPHTLVPNGTGVPLTYGASWIGGSLFGSAAQLATLVLTDANEPGWEMTSTTDLSGLASFTLSASDRQRVLSATVSATAPTDPQDYEVTAPAPLVVTWTGLVLTRANDADLPRTTLWANVGEIYSVGYRLAYSYDTNVPVPGARVTLSSSAGDFNGLTSSTGLVRVPTRMLTPSEVTFAASACHDPAEGPEQCTTGDSVTLRWARVVFEDLATTPSTDGWYNVGDSVDFAFVAQLDFGSGSVPAAGSSFAVLLQGTGDVLVADGSGGNSTTAFFDVITDLRALPVPMARVVPVSIVELPNPPASGIAYDAASGDFGRHRWTEIRLDVGADDTFVNVDDTVTLDYDATWAHDEDGNGSLDDAVADGFFDVFDFGSNVVAECDIVSGAGSCEVSFDAAYADGLTIEVQDSDTGVTRQAGGELTAVDVIWTRIVVSGCAISDTDGIVNVDDVVTLSCSAVYEHDATSPVPGAALAAGSTLPAGCEVTRADVTGGLLVAAIDCAIRASLTAASAVPFAISTATDDVTSTVGDVTLAAKWAEIVFTNLATDPSNGGWSNVTDGVEFAFDVRLVYSVDGDSEPADGADVTLTAGDTVVPLTTDAMGHTEATLTFDAVADVVPALAALTTPEGVTRYVASDFGRERWTEIVLDAVASGNFVNVGDMVTLDLTAQWAHDEDENDVADDAVASATVEVRDASNSVLTACTITNGAGACEVVKNVVYADGLTLVVVASDTDVTRQPGGVDLALDIVWTGIEIAGAELDRSFVNVNDTVNFMALATYAHDGSPVGDATLALGGTAPSGCVLLSGSIVDGEVTASVRCDTVVDEHIPLAIATADDGIMLADGLGFEATWTELIVSYTTSVAGGSLLDHNAPVVFTGSIQFAHDISTGTPPPAGTFFAFFVTTEVDGEEFNCVTEVLDSSCPVEVSKAAGSHTFSVSAASIADTDGDGFVEFVVTRMQSTPASVGYRWTSISFLGFECTTARNGAHACGSMTYQPRELVTVTATAVAGDDPTEVLAGADITLGGKALTTNANGEASRQFVRFGAGCVTVTARGLEATIDGQAVTWDSPRPQVICWT